MAKIPRFRLRDSDRSGFTFREIQLVDDNGSKVGPDEYDTPPPSKQSLGGEGDISPGDVRQNPTSYQAVNNFTTQYLTNSDSIKFVTGNDESGTLDVNFQWVYVSGTNSSVVLSSNPQITAGYQNAQITVQCVDSSITIKNGSGLVLRSAVFLMDSGAICNLIYNATNNLWYETSRAHQTKDYGVF